VVNRRDLLKTSSLLIAGELVFGMSASSTLFALAQSDQPLPPRPRLGEDQVLFIASGNPEAINYAASYNLRTTLTPKLRALCKTPEAVAAMVDWAREHAVPFALRGGGHCFEDFSQSSELVIDTRLLNRVVFDSAEQMVTAGAGALLSDIYKVVAQEGHAIPAGICQSVGIAGITLGGGIGHLARSAGLTCDVLKSLELVDAEGRHLSVNARSHADLFWASRGGGGGSFGVVTQFQFQTVTVPKVIVFEIDWVLTPQSAVHLMAAWQSLGPGAPEEISTTLYLTKHVKGKVLIRLSGQSIGTEQQLNSLIGVLTGQVKPWSPPRLRHQSFIEAANYFSGSSQTIARFYKSKSDIVTVPLSTEALGVLFEALESSPPGALTITCEALGGAISRVPVTATAIPHRKDALFLIQYSTEYWDQKKKTDNLLALARMYQAMRPAMSGAAYVNYCDADLKDWSRAYWQSNFERLKAAKRKYDPENVFRHGQSIPLR
jgi:FAD/FMN-containing dehydrogenase